MDQFRRTLATTQKYLGQLSISQKLLLAALSIVVLMALFLVSQYAGKADMVELLDPSAKPEDQQKAIAFLVENNIPYKPVSGKPFVAAGQRRQIVAMMAQSGQLPADTSLLFSTLAANQNWMNSKNQNDQAAMLALQNELARTIASFKGIKSAMVIISEPQVIGMGAAARKPTAVATVFTENGAPLEAGKVDAIAAMVAGAKTGLERSQVNVIDGTTGRQYQARSADDALATTYMEHKARVEGFIQEKIYNQLAYIPGRIVAVNAQVDVRKVTSKDRKFHPKGAGSISLQAKENTSTTTSTDPAPAAEPGLGSNVPMNINRAGGAGGAGGSSEETVDNEFENGLGAQDTTTVDPRGMPVKVNATINIPRDYIEALIKQAKGTSPAGGGGGGGGVGGGGAVQPTDAEIRTAFEDERKRLEADIKPLVEASSVGETATQAGEVVVSMIPVALAVIGAPTPGQTAGLGGGLAGGVGGLLSGGVVKQVVLGALAVLSMVMMLMMVRKAGKPGATPTPEELVGIPPALATGSDLIGEADETDTAMTGIEIDDNSLRTKKMLEEVAELVKSKPETAANVFNRWLSTEA